MNIIRKARGTELPKQAQRVFLCYNKHDIMARNIIIYDLISMDTGMDCVVSYLENLNVIIDEERLRYELAETQLLVIFVTLEMLQSIAQEKIPAEYRIAQELNVPILPILNDDGLFSLFNEKFGSIHCISMLDSEYRVKLRSQLEMFLAPQKEEIIKRIREKAFTATIYVSYRKHEIAEARCFMKAFHDIEGFESISVWYDNFLTAGKDFNDKIQEAILNSNAIVLIVTPDLATKNNYIQKVEYPFAQKLRKPVIPVAVLSTSDSQFFNSFPGAECPIPLDDTAALQKTFREKLGEFAFSKQLDSERAYLLGMAYLKGIGVERDFDRAVKLLSNATEDNTTASIDAANQLANIYENGIGININFDKALQWYQRALVIREKVFGNEHPDTAITYNNIALVYNNLGEYSKAFEWYEKALVIREKVLGKEHPETAATYNNIALVYNNLGKYSKALEWYVKALVIREKTLGKEHPETAATYNNIALVYNNLGEYSKALEWYKRALVIREKVLGKEHPETAATYNNIALIYNNLGEYLKALELYSKALDIREKTLGKEHPDTATTYDNIALVYDNQGYYSKALEWHIRALVIREKILGKNHPDTAATYNNIAAIYNNMGDYFKALELNQKALTIQEQVLGMKHLDTANTYSNIAISFYYQGEFLKAQDCFEKTLIVYEKVLGREHPDTANTYKNMALVYNNLGDYSKALEWNLKALVIQEKMLGENHPYIANIYNNIALVYNNIRDYSEALEWNFKALAIQEKMLGKKHPSIANTYSNIAKCYYYKGEFTKSQNLFEKALSIQEEALGKEHPSIANTYNNIALVCNNLGDYQKALQWFEKALSIQEKILGEKHPDTANTYNNIALVYNNLGDYQKALKCFEKALSIQEKMLGEKHPDTANTYNNIALVYNNLGDYQKALKCFEKALIGYEKVIGKDNQDTIAIYNNIANIYYRQGDDSNALYFFKKTGKNILELFVNMNENKMKKVKIRKAFHKLLDSDKDCGEFFKETIGNEKSNKKINYFKDIYLTSLFIISQLYIDDNPYEKSVAYYREKKVTQEMLFNNSEFRLNAINYSNDPTEGKILLDYLFGEIKYTQLKITNTDYGAFAGCFTFNYNSLNQFRLYGKDTGNLKEGTGLSIVFKPSFFSKGGKIPKLLEAKNSSFIEDNKLAKNIQSEKNKCALFRCIYIDPETNHVATVGQKDTYLFFRDQNKDMANNEIMCKISNYQIFINDIIKSIRTELEELQTNIRKLKLNDDEKIIVGQLLLNLRYLCKHVAFKEEQECRILKIYPLSGDKIEKTPDFNQMYVKYDNISKYVDQIYFGPKATGIELFQDIIKHKGLNIPCVKSTNPLA